MNPSNGIKYRPDIDGLRAIAVISVVFFHANVAMFSGGYVGVDIFFVISGFLITSIIVREIENGSFSILRFYERRFRRILPILFVVISITLLVGIVLLSPNQLKRLGASSAATSLFSSNILFYLQSGYFDSASELKPLLHTWSLAVEEQFYMVIPFLLLATHTRNANIRKILIVVLLISLLICIVGTKINPTSSFYLIHARAWELLLGSLLALKLLPELRSRIQRDLLGIIGIILISFSIVVFSSDTNFPGVSAMLPTVGATLIIYVGMHGKSIVGNLLSVKPIVFVGLISYSLYLWHWPILVYFKQYSIIDLSNLQRITFLSVTIVLSIFSWKYIEAPIRTQKILKSRHSLFFFTTTISIVVITAGSLLYFLNGLPLRGKSDNGFYTVDSEWIHWGECETIARGVNGKSIDDYCVIGDENSKPDFFLWGDSHARALASAIDTSAKMNGVAGRIATKAACPPLLSIERPGRKTCEEFNEKILEYLSESPSIKKVFLVARWALSLEGTRYKKEHGKPVKLVDNLTVNNVTMNNEVLFGVGLTRTVDELQKIGKDVVIVKTIPEVGYDVPNAYHISKLTNRDLNELIAPTVGEYNQRNQKVFSIFDVFEEEKDVMIINPALYLCGDQHCKVLSDGKVLYRDDDHLSTFGARSISPVFESAMRSFL